MEASTYDYDTQRIFIQATQARDITEPLHSFDALGNGTCGKGMKPFDASTILDDTTSIIGVVRDEVLRKRAGFASRRRGDEAIADIERLRNNLAHAQDIVSHDQEIIVVLGDNLEHVIAIGRRNA